MVPAWLVMLSYQKSYFQKLIDRKFILNSTYKYNIKNIHQDYSGTWELGTPKGL